MESLLREEGAPDKDERSQGLLNVRNKISVNLSSFFLLLSLLSSSFVLSFLLSFFLSSPFLFSFFLSFLSSFFFREDDQRLRYAEVSMRTATDKSSKLIQKYKCEREALKNVSDRKTRGHFNQREQQSFF